MKSISVYIALVCSVLSFISQAQTTRYVRQTATGNGTGSNWNNASADLQAVINASTSGDRIFVATGTYKPNRRADATGTITTNNRYNSFVLKAGVAVYGGFDPDNSITEITHRRRLPGEGADGSSILSGDLGTANDYDDNAYHVVVAAGSGTYIFDGFVVRYGNANAGGNITVNGQTAYNERGGGMAILNATVTVTNCWIQANRGVYGAGAYTTRASAFYNCIISGNYAHSRGGSGGNGGGLYLDNTTSPGTLLVSCTLTGNRANNGNGGAVWNEDGLCTLRNSIVYYNSANGSQNGIRNSGGTVTAQYCLINDESQITTQTNITSGNPSFTTAVQASSAPFTSGNYRLQAGSPALNVGNNSYQVTNLDIDGNPRLQDNTIDLGAYEREGTYILYVKENGTGLGYSWSDAAGDLQEVINAATSRTTIFVAQGTYKPNRRADAAETITANDRNNAFVLKSDVKIYGGFAGTETTLAQRNLNAGNTSTLSGDFNENDVISGSGGTLSISNNDENAYHVVVSAGSMGNAVLDGFTIKGGYANGSPNITVNSEQVYGLFGGGMFARGGTPTVSNCTFTGNRASYGGAIDAGGKTPALTNCTFYKNYASGDGGGVSYAGIGTQGTITNCIFWGNKAVGRGGGLLFSNSTAAIVLTNCTITGNQGTGGGFYQANATPIYVRNSIIYGNNSGIVTASVFLYCSYSLIQGETSTADGNINGNTDPLFVDADNNDFRLQPLVSPGINSGSNSLVPAQITTDIIGNNRRTDCSVDMGVYESTATTPAPVIDNASQVFCTGTTVAALQATGANLKWYQTSSGGTALSADALLTSGSYYVSQTINSGCESSRATVSVTVNTTAVPIAASAQSISSAGIVTVSRLAATGQNLKWYNTASGGTVLSSSALIVTGTYYVSQTVGSCESSRTAVNVTVTATIPEIIYVNATASGNGDGTSWANATLQLADILLYARIKYAANNAVFDTTPLKIYVAKGTYKPLYNAADGNYTADGGRDNAFVMVKNVQIYGGFDPDNGITDLTHARQLPSSGGDGGGFGSTLSGDFSNNDFISGDGSTLVITHNTENAYHVVISTGDMGGVVLDGFTITGGYANRTSNITVNSGEVYSTNGGGMYIRGSGAPTVSNCTFIGNRAATGAGLCAVVIAPAVITNCTFSKNYADYGAGLCYANVGNNKRITNSLFWGNRATTQGGGLYLINNTSVILTNCTIVGNQGTGGGVRYGLQTALAVRNSIIYGNSSGISVASGADAFTQTYSLVQGRASTSNGNINGNTDPLFTNASAGDYTLKNNSLAIGKGSNTLFTGLTAASTDLANNQRVYNYGNDGVIDMGAYEYQGLAIPTITDFADISKTYGDDSFTLTAPTSTSNGTFIYSSSDGNVATISGNTVTIVGAGTATITATQAATDNYNGSTISLTLTVGKANPVLSGFADISKTYGDSDFVLTAPTSNSDGEFTYASSDATVATINGNTVTIVGAGTAIITATQAATDNYNGGTISLTLTVGKANPVLSGFADISKTYGDSDFVLTAPTSNSNGAFTYSSSDENVAVIDGKNVTIVGAGTATITAAQAATANYNGGSISLTLTVGKANQTITFYPLDVKMVSSTDFVLAASANSGLEVSYISNNTAVAEAYKDGSVWKVKIKGAGIANITASQAGNTNYNAANNVWQQLIVIEVVLPVELVNFTAKKEHNFALLDWQTASEKDNKGFALERSADGVNFVKIGEVSTSHVSHLTSQIYHFTDRTPLNGNNYYKLVQVDKNGNETELGVKSLTFNLTPYTFNLFPNPTYNQVNVTFTSGRYTKLEVVDLNGRVLQQIALSLAQSNQSVLLGTYPTTTYFIKLSGKGYTKTAKVVKW